MLHTIWTQTREVLNELNTKIKQTQQQEQHASVELIYADDTDFVKDKHKNKMVRKEADNILSVKVNSDKWEHTTIQRGDQQVEKEWRETKKLGSLLGDY